MTQADLLAEDLADRILTAAQPRGLTTGRIAGVVYAAETGPVAEVSVSFSDGPMPCAVLDRFLVSLAAAVAAGENPVGLEVLVVTVDQQPVVTDIIRRMG